MPDVSLITSLYKTEQFLPQYIAAATQIARDARDAGLHLEFVIVPNAASDTERDLLTALEKDLISEKIATVQIHYVAREPLYASWNRGVNAATGDIFAFWNVDDRRTLSGLQEGHQRINAGADLVDFAFEFQSSSGTQKVDVIYSPDSLNPRTGVGPFFMLHRRLYDRAGAFNEHFRIAGDFEFTKREIVRQSSVYLSDVVAGTFVLHDSNLSGGIHPREWVEFNMALLLHNAYDLMRPVDPDLFQEVLDEWGAEKPFVPDEILEKFIGDNARKRYERYQWERKLPGFVRRIMLALARRGLIHSVDWEFHHGSSG